MRTRDNHWRLDLYAPGATEPSAGVWADVRRPGEGELLLTLAHPYPDLAVEPGWRAARRGVSYEVVTAGGGELLVTEVGS